MNRVVLASSPLVGSSAMVALGGIIVEDGFEVTIPDTPAGLGDFTETDVVVSLVPDEHTRATFRSSCPRIHRSTFSAPIPARAFSGPCGFEGFGDGYAADVAESRRRGWPTTVIEGAHHLWPVVEPVGSAVALVEMIRRLRR